MRESYILVSKVRRAVFAAAGATPQRVEVQEASNVFELTKPSCGRLAASQRGIYRMNGELVLVGRRYSPFN
jgi:hypothetical protein